MITNELIDQMLDEGLTAEEMALVLKIELAAEKRKPTTAADWISLEEAIGRAMAAATSERALKLWPGAADQAIKEGDRP